MGGTTLGQLLHTSFYSTPETLSVPSGALGKYPWPLESGPRLLGFHLYFLIRLTTLEHLGNCLYPPSTIQQEQPQDDLLIGKVPLECHPVHTQIFSLLVKFNPR